MHSLILDPDDKVWAKSFTTDKLDEIKSFEVKPLQKLPEELQLYLDSFDKKSKSGSELCEYAESQEHIPLTEFDKRWIRQSMVEVFVGDKLRLEDYSESDSLHKLWSFVHSRFVEMKDYSQSSINAAVLLLALEEMKADLLKAPKKDHEKQEDQKLAYCSILERRSLELVKSVKIMSPLLMISIRIMD